jgi:biopolymer transport protein ExbD
MAPMIDMIFLLLIFFLVAAKWRPQEDFLPLQLPAAQARPSALGKPEPLILHIFATKTGCKVQIGQLQTVGIENQNGNIWQKYTIYFTGQALPTSHSK